jgi:hypothetical protein
MTATETASSTSCPKTKSTRSTPRSRSIPKKITAEDLANKDKGVTVTVSGVKKGDKIKDSLTAETETAEADGDYKLHLWYEGNPKNLEAGKVPFTVTIDREGTESETLNGNINVVDDTETSTPR